MKSTMGFSTESGLHLAPVSAVRFCETCDLFKLLFKTEEEGHAKTSSTKNPIILFALIVPAAITLLALISHICQPFLCHLPQWTMAFVTEIERNDHDVVLESKTKSTRSTKVLYCLFSVGLVLQIATVIYPKFSYEHMSLLMAWVRDILRHGRLMLILHRLWLHYFV